MTTRAGQSASRTTTLHLFLGVAMLLCTGTSFAQEMPSLVDPYSLVNSNLSTGNSPDSNATARTERDPTASRNDNSRYSNPESSTVLSTNQIIEILHARPEVAVDLKHVMSEFFLKRGIAVQENSITDEMLFSNIATNSQLRQNISVWLRARGYASDQDFARSDESADELQSLQPTPELNTNRDEQRTNEDPRQIALDFRNLPADTELLPRDSQYGDAAQALSDERLGDLSSRSRENPYPSESGSKSDDNSPQLLSPRVKPSAQLKPRHPEPPNDQLDLLHQPTPYNLQALRDLYTQVPDQTAKVRRFGSDVFLTRGLPSREMPIDLPIGPDYVIGPGDGLTISLWGGVSETFTRVVDREGRLVLPEAGSLIVAGLTLERTQALVQDALRPQFKDAHVTVSVTRLRTVRIYVVGDVQRPGAYDISSLSTPLNALYSAGGPTSVGSLRTVRQYRGKQLIRDIDLYDFLVNGIRSDVARLEPGDTILVPPAGPQVEISGMVKRPAIYEFKGNITLADALDQAGGPRTSAALAHIRVERIQPDGHRATLEVGLADGSTLESARKQMEAFAIRDGDRVLVAPILPYSEKTIYLTGHVVRPGKLPYRDGMLLSEALRSYQDLLPEPADRGQIIRLMPPDFRPQAIDFNLPDVLAGNAAIHLQPFDTIRILGRYEADAPRVTVRGEVLHPGSYALVDGMTTAQLVRIAGGFKRSALLDQADLASYTVTNGRQVVSHRHEVAIGNAVNAGDANADVPLKPGDVLTIHQISGWNDIGASVILVGEVNYPGTYGLQDGERLSSVIRRAGGFRDSAYPDGAVLVRKQVKELEDKSRAELIRQIETTSVSSHLGQSVNGSEDSGTAQLLIQQQNQVLQRLRSQESIGRLVIRISADVASWANTPSDIELRSGDILTIPKRPGFILISGQVYNPSAITYVPGKNAEWYLSRAGGATEVASKKEIFVVRANGLVVGHRTGEWFREDVLSTRLNPGDTVVVPQKIIGGSIFWRNMLASAQVLSSIAFTAALTLR